MARIVGGRRLARAAGGTRQRIAKLVDGGNVSAVEQVERVGDDVDLEAFAEGDAPGETQIHLEKVRRREGVPAEVQKSDAVLAGLLAGAIYPVVLPKDPPLPAVTYALASQPTEWTQDQAQYRWPRSQRPQMSTTQPQR